MKTYVLLALTIGIAGCNSSQDLSDKIAAGPAAKPISNVVLMSEVNWEQLNPARGDKSPKAGTLWGDRNGTGPTGFLVKFVDGFSSPPHFHNVSYRGVVISGLIHNDDPGAAEMWLPAGSFWTQPKGEVHITAAKGSTIVAYIEIDQGPYLVLPAKEAFDSGERPVNVDRSNLVWMDQPGIPASADGPRIAFLWGNPSDNHLHGSLIKLPAGFAGKIDSHGSSLRAVVIQGKLRYQMAGQANVKILEPGSHFSSNGASVHQVSCETGAECIAYVRMEGKYDVIPVQINK